MSWVVLVMMCVVEGGIVVYPVMADLLQKVEYTKEGKSRPAPPQIITQIRDSYPTPTAPSGHCDCILAVAVAVAVQAVQRWIMVVVAVILCSHAIGTHHLSRRLKRSRVCAVVILRTTLPCIHLQILSRTSRIVGLSTMQS